MDFFILVDVKNQRRHLVSLFNFFERTQSTLIQTFVVRVFEKWNQLRQNMEINVWKIHKFRKIGTLSKSESENLRIVLKNQLIFKF